MFIQQVDTVLWAKYRTDPKDPTVIEADVDEIIVLFE